MELNQELTKDGYTFGGSALLEAQTYWIPKNGRSIKRYVR